MSPVARIFSIFMSLCIFILIFELVRRKKIKERYALLWLFISSIILLLSIFDKLLFAITNFLGIALPINGLFILGFMFFILLNVNFTILLSDLTDKNSKIIQKLALLEFEMKSFRK